MLKKIKELKNIEPVEVTLIGEPIIEYVPEFSCLYYNVECVGETPTWFKTTRIFLLFTNVVMK